MYTYRFHFTIFDLSMREIKKQFHMNNIYSEKRPNEIESYQGLFVSWLLLIWNQSKILVSTFFIL